jgi:hypothetical protein
MPPGVPAPINFGIEAGQAVTKAIADGRSPLEADIPSEVGGPVNVLWDVTYEQPSYADDDFDLPGPSTGEVVTDPRDALQEARNIGPDWLDEVTALVALLAVFGAALWLLRPILSITAGVIGE